jgi:hypothetical protein
MHRISPRTVAAAIVHAFGIEAALDDATREMLHTYKPLITQDTGLPVGAMTSTPAVELQHAQREPQSPTQPVIENSSVEKDEALADDKRTTNCLLVDDNKVNLKICIHLSIART